MFNPELAVIKLLLKLENYQDYRHTIDDAYIKDNYRELHHVYLTLDVLQETPGVYSVDDLAFAFYAKYPDADKTTYGALFKTLSELQITDDVGRDTLEQIKRRKALLKLSETSFRVAQGLAKQEDLDDIYDDLITEVDHTEEEFPVHLVTNDLEELVDGIKKEQGLRWRLDFLNKSLGSLRKGDFGFLFARPETGKTTFLASEASAFTFQAKAPVVWFNNEEQGYKVMLRVYQAYFGITSDQLLSNVKQWKTKFLDETEGRFYLFDDANADRSSVEKVVEKLSPCLVIYDQLDKIKGFSADRPDLQLGAIYQWARELAKNNHAAIGVSQADGHAEGVRYLTMEHVANAKTAKQAEADWILGIGKTNEMDAAYTRYLSICKNKLLGDPDSIDELRHGRQEVLIEPSIARYKDIIKYN